MNSPGNGKQTKLRAPFGLIAFRRNKRGGCCCFCVVVPLANRKAVFERGGRGGGREKDWVKAFSGHIKGWTCAVVTTAGKTLRGEVLLRKVMSHYINYTD